MLYLNVDVFRLLRWLVFEQCFKSRL